MIIQIMCYFLSVIVFIVSLSFFLYFLYYFLTLEFWEFQNSQSSQNDQFIIFVRNFIIVIFYMISCIKYINKSLCNLLCHKAFPFFHFHVSGGNFMPQSLVNSSVK